MTGLLLVALGGALGAALRHGVGLLIAPIAPGVVGPATVFVNIVGSGLIGALVAWLSVKAPSPSDDAMRLFLAVGVLGGFTTFSAFSLDLFRMLELGQWGRGVLYACGSFGAGLGALAGAYALVARALT